jgi:hypothetical protein
MKNKSFNFFAENHAIKLHLVFLFFNFLSFLLLFIMNLIPKKKNQIRFLSVFISFIYFSAILKKRFGMGIRIVCWYRNLIPQVMNEK